ncbi:hypothetical protein V8C35DRAFT_311862 [Trichoderma chlorosporum]
MEMESSGEQVVSHLQGFCLSPAQWWTFSEEVETLSCTLKEGRQKFCVSADIAGSFSDLEKVVGLLLNFLCYRSDKERVSTHPLLLSCDKSMWFMGKPIRGDHRLGCFILFYRTECFQRSDVVGSVPCFGKQMFVTTLRRTMGSLEDFNCCYNCFVGGIGSLHLYYMSREQGEALACAVSYFTLFSLAAMAKDDEEFEYWSNIFSLLWKRIERVVNHRS